MARGTTFGNIHSHVDLNLIQQKVEVEPAEPKLNLIEIPGADGAVDITEQPAGRVTYKTRKITWTFALYPGENWDAKHQQVSNALNGRRCDITLDTDPEYYYQGRLAVKKHNVDGLLRQIVVEAICQPYKLRQEKTLVMTMLTAEYTAIRLLNERKPVIPYITVMLKDVMIRWGGLERSLSPGSYRFLDIELQEGENVLEAKAANASASITIDYREGAL